MAPADFAWLLAVSGERVLAIDWDLEAPGLHRYFKPFLVDPELTETNGLIDAFWALTSRALSNERSTAKRRPLDDVDFDPSGVDLEDYINPLKWEFYNKGCIDFIGAGR